jgi:hypothetical protein
MNSELIITKENEKLAQQITQILKEGFSHLRLDYLGHQGLIKLRSDTKDATLQGEDLQKLLDLGLELRYIDLDTDGHLQLTLKIK